MMKYLRYGICAGCGILWRKRFFDKASKNIDKYPLEERYRKTQELIRYANKKALHMEFFIQGQENLPQGTTFFYPNHVSNADPVTLLAILQQPVAFVSKKEVEKMPIIGKVVKTIGGKFIDRNDLRSEVKVFREIEKELDKEKDLSYIIFPEGTRAKAPDYALQDFHPGSFKIPLNRNIPIVPVAMYFTKRVLSTKYHYHRYPIQVSFLPAIYPEDYPDFSTKDISLLVHNLIQQELDKLRVKDRELVKKVNGYSDKKLDKILYR